MQIDPILEEYGELKAQIKALTERAEFLQPVAFAAIKETIDATENPDTATVKLDIGTYQIKRIKSWTYSPSVIELEKQFKESKQEEQRSGAASYVVTESLAFIPNKDV